MNPKNFIARDVCLAGSRIDIDCRRNIVASLSSQQVFDTFNVSNEEKVQMELYNEKKSKITSISLHPKYQNSLVVGTDEGLVLYIKPTHKLNLDRADVLYKGEGAIRQVSFSQNAKMVGIAAKQERNGVIFDMKAKRFLRLGASHDGSILSISFSKDEKHVFTIGMQGQIHIYAIFHEEQQVKGAQDSQSEDMFAQVTNKQFTFQTRFESKFQICSESLLKKIPFFRCCFAMFATAETYTKNILMSGQTTLQIAKIMADDVSYSLHPNIFEDKEILIVEALNVAFNQFAKSVVTITETKLTIWNYSEGEKLLTFKLAQAFGNKMLTTLKVIDNEMPTFAFVMNHKQSDGKVYIFKNIEILQVKQIERSDYLRFEQASQNQDNIDQKQKSIQQKIVKKRKIIVEESIAQKLITKYPQFVLQKSFAEYDRARFLLVNSIGCVIERIEGDSSIIELEIHDKSKVYRIRYSMRDKPYSIFALKNDSFIYASSNHLVFQNQLQLKEKYQGWEIKWNDILAASISSGWVAVLSKQEIKIFDMVGFQMHAIAFDRQFVSMDAYQNLLAVVYHSSIPVWGCQNLKMRIYDINNHCIRFDREVILPISPNSLLKWFGFSEDGALFCQDSDEIIRFYNMSKNEWPIVYQLQKKKQRMFIQHITHFQIYGFKIDQFNDEVIEQPKVMPRSLPRKYLMELKSFTFDYLTSQQQSYIRRLMVKNMLIGHEQFRYRNWYKHKYSRSKESPYYGISNSIKNEEEIKTLKMQIDLQLTQYIKSFLKDFDKLRPDKRKVAHSLLMICQRQSHYQETKDHIKQMTLKQLDMNLPSTFENIRFNPYDTKRAPKSKMNELTLLDRLVNETWLIETE